MCVCVKQKVYRPKRNLCVGIRRVPKAASAPARARRRVSGGGQALVGVERVGGPVLGYVGRGRGESKPRQGPSLAALVQSVLSRHSRGQAVRGGEDAGHQ
ncbi:hypothetical protein E2C01_070911 [Portunus trituberculatus]|uniref:Uncharacterized protein n=1 Tax=Portunus trituberculatus TaxID=210409 RepID=A0A5B7I6Q4_PORTR|nr:hypothetical protein [Portunus trituberculatus]